MARHGTAWCLRHCIAWYVAACREKIARRLDTIRTESVWFKNLYYFYDFVTSIILLKILFGAFVRTDTSNENSFWRPRFGVGLRPDLFLEFLKIMYFFTNFNSKHKHNVSWKHIFFHLTRVLTICIDSEHRFEWTQLLKPPTNDLCSSFLKLEIEHMSQVRLPKPNFRKRREDAVFGFSLKQPPHSGGEHFGIFMRLVVPTPSAETCSPLRAKI